MAAERYLVCNCGHKDITHSATFPHPCRREDCECPCFVSEDTTNAILGVGDEVTLSRIDFTGRVKSVLRTPDPVVVLRSDGGAELTMRASAIERELD